MMNHHEDKNQNPPLSEETEEIKQEHMEQTKELDERELAPKETEEENKSEGIESLNSDMGFFDLIELVEKAL